MSLGGRLLARSRWAHDGTGCLLWTGSLRHEYGQISTGGHQQSMPAHRASYEIFIGPIPKGLHVDHVYARGCRHKNCVNPLHLEAVTNDENQRRRGATVTHCPRGHEYTTENTMTHNGMRSCRECSRVSNRAWQKERTSCLTCGQGLSRGSLATHVKRKHTNQGGTYP